MFCPNCGAPNPDTATTCEKCGFNVKGTASPKFKGTMLMMNQGGPPAVPNMAGTPPMPVAAPGGSPPGAPAQPAPIPNSKLKGTMIGVAPPSAGGVTPPSATQPSPTVPGGGAPGTTAPGVPAPHFGGAQPPGAAQPFGAGQAVNPLESTVAADQNMFSPFAQAGHTPAGGAPAPGLQQSPGGYGPGVPPPGSLGSTPDAMAHGHAGAQQPAAPGGYPPGPGYPAGYQAGPGHADPQQQPAPHPGAMAPFPGSSPMTGPVAGGGFTQRSPMKTFFLAMITCGIYAVFWFKDTGEELAQKGADIPPWWHLLIPILGLIWLWKWAKGLEAATRGQLAAGTSFLLIWFLGGIGMAMLQSSMNKFSG